MSIVLEGISTDYKNRLATLLSEELGLELVKPAEEQIGLEAYGEYAKLSTGELWTRWFPSEWVWSETHASPCPLSPHQLISLGVGLSQKKGILIIYLPTDNEIVHDFFSKKLDSKAKLRDLLAAKQAYKKFVNSPVIEDFQARGLTVLVLKNWHITKTHRALIQLYKMVQNNEF